VGALGCTVVSVVCAGGGALIVMYGISKAVFWMTSEFLTINFTTVCTLALRVAALTRVA
jgi:hypothetical protein